MKLIKVACPHCGGKLNIESGQNRTVCDYCGQVVIFESEHPNVDQMKEMGYEFEQGRIRALYEGRINTELLEKLNRDLWTHGERKRLDEEMKKAQLKLRNAKQRQNTSSNLYMIYIFLLVSLAVGVLLSISETENGLSVLCGTFLGMGILFYPVIKKYVEIIKAKADTDYERVLATTQKACAENEEKMRQLQYSVVPERFRKPDSIIFFRRCVEEGTAFTIPDAIRQYTEYLEKQEEKKYRAEQLKRMDEANRQRALNTFAMIVSNRK